MMREETGMAQIRGIIFDVDGTLVNSNDAHAHAWVEAMAEQGYHVSFETVRPLIGMGGDKVLPQTLGIAKESEEGKRISQRRKEIFKQRYLPQLKAFPGAMELLERMHEQGLKLIIASSAEPDELQGLLQVIGPHVSELFDLQTSAQDAKHSKPDPDVLSVAVQRSGYGPQELVMVGDTAYDIEAAAKVKVKTVAFRCGGWSDKDLAGAISIYDGPADLLAHYDTSVFVK
jgi:HAD superfamily hydrolase (TIGR01509 family)